MAQFKMASSNQAHIQLLTMGNWITIQTCVNNSGFVTAFMEQVQQSHPGQRVRAIDPENGRIIDILS